MNFVRRCKSKTGDDRHNTMHAANNNATYCGHELDEMWFVESSHGLSVDDVTCRKCISVIKSARE